MMINNLLILIFSDVNCRKLAVCIAGILRYQVDFQTMELPDDVGNDFDLDDYWTSAGCVIIDCAVLQ